MTKRHFWRGTWVMLAIASSFSATISAQTADTARAATAVFTGRLKSVRDSSAVSTADIRLIRVDSAVRRKDSRGNDSLEIFVDSLKTRVTVSNADGAFSIRGLPAGAYLFDIRRIGFEMLHGAVAVDSTTLSATIYLKVVSQVLAKVVVTESSVDRVKEKLDRDGFVERSHLGIAAEFIERAEILRRKPQKLQDILEVYGLDNPTIRLDRMPISYDAVRDYPADLIIGIEIYRHSRPTEFNGTRNVPNALSPGGQARDVLVLVWTFIP